MRRLHSSKTSFLVVAALLCACPGGTNGQVDGGDGTQDAGYQPLPSAKATTVSCNRECCAVTEAGTVRCWGLDGANAGALGQPLQSKPWGVIPVEVQSLTGATATSAGENFHCALLSGGLVKCWGKNGSGQLGSGVDVTDSSALANSAVPIAVAGISGATKLVSGDSHSCVLVGGGVKCWGDNNVGKLGSGKGPSDGTQYHFSNKAADVVGLTSGVIDLFASVQTTCALKGDHSVWCWGAMVGHPDGPTPVQVLAGDDGFTAFSFAYSGERYLLCGVTSGGQTKCLATLNFGHFTVSPTLGRGADMTSDPKVSAQVVGLSGVTEVTTDGLVSCAIASGAVKCWGEQVQGAESYLGLGATTFTNTPQALPGLTTGATSVSQGVDITCAVAAGAVKCWGNRLGALGVDTIPSNTGDNAASVNTPISVVSLP